MSKCRCCEFNNAWVMKPLCDRCYLGWNDCCAFRIALDETIAEASRIACEELGFYEVPFSLQCKRLSRKLKKERELEKMGVIA